MRRLLPGAVAVVAALVVVQGASLLGVDDAVNRTLRRAWYATPSPWEGDPGVTLVAVDDETIAAWGVPPWRWERFEKLFHALLQGGARLVAVVSPGPRLLPTAPPPDGGVVAYGVASGSLVLPPATGSRGQPAVALDDTGPVEAIRVSEANAVGGAEAGLAARVFARLGASAGDDASGALRVNFLGREQRLPVVSALRVAAGGLPPGALSGRVALVGLTAPTLVDALPTPVGPRTAAEVHAAAVRAALLGLTWREVGPLPRASLVIALALLLVAVGRRARGGRAALAAAGLGVAVLGLDYVLFSHFAVLWGAASPLIAVLSGVSAGRVLRARAAPAASDSGSRRAVAGAPLSTLGAEVGRGGSREDEKAFWLHLTRLNRLYLDVEGALLAEVAEGSWHVHIRAGSGVQPQDVLEKRRDIRRPPWRAGWQSRKAQWLDDFMRADLGLRTLAVPLVGEDRVLGFWILNVRSERTFDSRDEAMIDVLAGQLSAQVLAYRRGGSREALDVGEDDAGLQSFARQQRRMAAVVEQLPVGILVATLWGDVRSHNSALRRLLGGTAAEALLAGDLAAVLEAVAGIDREAAVTAMRSVLFERPSLAFAGGRAVDGRVLDVVLSRVAWKSVAAERPGASELLTTRFVLTATPVYAAPAPSPALAQRPGVDARVARPTVPPPLPEPEQAQQRSADLHVVVRRAFVRARHALPPQADLQLLLPDEAPVVQGDPGLLVEALAGLLSAMCRLVPSRSVCRLTATVRPRDVRVLISNPDHSLPLGITPSLVALEASVEGASPALAPLPVASGYLEACGATVDVACRPREGTRLDVRLPRADVA